MISKTTEWILMFYEMIRVLVFVVVNVDVATI